MREFIIKFDTDKPLSELASGTNLRAMMKVTGDCDEIIRCKDCLKANICIVYRDSKDPYGFCKWAKRR